MIIKNFELGKLKSKNVNFFLFYGENEGFKDEKIKQIFINDFKGNVEKFEESEVLNNADRFISSIINKSFFEEKKIIILSRVSDKIVTLIKPIIVRKSSDQSGKFEIIAGERRWQAAQSAGLHEVPVVTIEADDLKSLEFAIVENVQRSDLNPIEEAKGYKKLIDEFDYDQEKVSKFIGKSRAHVANSLRLLSLPNEVILLIEENKISAGHAKVLVGLDNAHFLAKKIFEKKLSVRQAENLIRALKNNKTNNLTSQNPNLTSLETSIEDKTGIKVED